MVDLNLWRLEYPGESLEFGTHETGFPFTRQVTVGPVEVVTNDADHPLSDGLVFGVDILRGRTLGFAGAHILPVKTPTHYRHERPLILGDRIEAVWRGDVVREVPGGVAELTHVDRGRMVYGRPRRYAADHAKLRHGWTTWAADFTTVDDRFYGAEEKTVTVALVAGSVGGYETPFEFPLSAVGGSGSPRALLDNAGKLSTWPVVTINGPIYAPGVELLSLGGGTLWRMWVDAYLASDESLVIDCRPWVRSAKLNGTNVPGLLRGATMGQARIPVGASELKLTGVDGTGTATVNVSWRDAHPGL